MNLPVGLLPSLPIGLELAEADALRSDLLDPADYAKLGAPLPRKFLRPPERWHPHAERGEGDTEYAAEDTGLSRRLQGLANDLDRADLINVAGHERDPAFVDDAIAEIRLAAERIRQLEDELLVSGQNAKELQDAVQDWQDAVETADERVTVLEDALRAIIDHAGFVIRDDELHTCSQLLQELYDIARSALENTE